MLEIESLTCGYGSKIVLEDINLEVETGELIGIIGPNGSGKTTLLRAVTGVLKPREGKIFLEGMDIQQMEFKALAKKMAVVSQSPPTNSMSVEEFVLLGRIPYYQRFQFLETRQDLEIAKKMMDLTDTFRLKDQSISQISGGERQLAVIARALTQEPRLLLLDEPTAHLDITHQVGILDLIKRLNKKFGLTVIMVLHDLNLASEYCSRIILLDKGRIFREGSPSDVLTYETVEKVYQTVVVVERNPISSKPYILIVSEVERRKSKT